MRRRKARVLFLFACGVACLAAGSAAWQNKDFTDWTEKDAQVVMTASPWAKQMPLPASARTGVMVIETGSSAASPPAASLGNPANTTTGANMSNPSIGGSNGPAEQNGNRNVSPAATPSTVTPNAGAPAPPSLLTVIWASATPVRLAVLRLRSGAKPPAPDQVARASAERPHYIIAVVGLPAPEGGSDPKALAQGAYLNLKGKAPLQAIDSDYRRIGNSDVYFFRFLKSALPISAADREVEFKVAFGQTEVKRKFDLGEMQYKGQLAL